MFEKMFGGAPKALEEEVKNTGETSVEEILEDENESHGDSEASAENILEKSPEPIDPEIAASVMENTIGEDIDSALVEEGIEFADLNKGQKEILEKMKKGPFNRVKQAVFAAMVIATMQGAPEAKASTGNNPGGDAIESIWRGVQEGVRGFGKKAGREIERSGERTGREIGKLPERENDNRIEKNIIKDKIESLQRTIAEHEKEITRIKDELKNNPETEAEKKIKDEIKDLENQLAQNSPTVNIKLMNRQLVEVTKKYDEKKDENGLLSTQDFEAYKNEVEELRRVAEQRKKMYEMRVELAKAQGATTTQAQRIILSEAKSLNDTRQDLMRKLERLQSSETRDAYRSIRGHEISIARAKRDIKRLKYKYQKITHEQYRDRQGIGGIPKDLK